MMSPSPSRQIARARFLALFRQRNVGRQQEIAAGKRHAVSGEEHHRGVARLDRLREPEQVIDHLRAIEIFAADHLETEALQCVADRAGVIDRFRELPVFGKIAVAVVADDERDAILSERQAGLQGRRQTQDQDSEDFGEPVHGIRWNSL